MSSIARLPAGLPAGLVEQLGLVFLQHGDEVLVGAAPPADPRGAQRSRRRRAANITNPSEGNRDGASRGSERAARVLAHCLPRAKMFPE